MKKNKTKAMIGIGTMVWMMMAGMIGGVEASTSLNPEAEKVKTEKNGGSEESASNSAMLENLERLAEGSSSGTGTGGEANEEMKAIYEQLESKKNGFIARVISFKDKTVKVADPQKGDKGEQYLTFDQSTVLVSGSKQENADSADLAEWLEVDSWLVVIGVTENDVFLPRRVLVSSTDLTPKKKYIKKGTFVSISGSKLKFIPLGEEEEIELSIARTTEYQDSSGEAIKSREFVKGSDILVTGVSGGNGAVTVNTLRLL